MFRARMRRRVAALCTAISRQPRRAAVVPWRTLQSLTQLCVAKGRPSLSGKWPARGGGVAYLCDVARPRCAITRCPVVRPAPSLKCLNASLRCAVAAASVPCLCLWSTPHGPSVVTASMIASTQLVANLLHVQVSCGASGAGWGAGGQCSARGSAACCHTQSALAAGSCALPCN